MSDVGALVLRMVVSLAIVLAFVAVAYSIARRRQSGLGLPGTPRIPGAPRRRPRAAAGGGLHVEARAGLARGSAAVAVRFADRIVLIGVTDGAAATVLAEVPAQDWDSQTDDAEEQSRPMRTPLDPNGVVTERPTFVEALRTATSRRP
jgi:hypothetical protein